MIDYFGRLVGPIPLEIAAQNNDAVPKLRQPREITDLCPLLRIFNIFRLIVFSFSRIAALLSWKLQQDQFRELRRLNKEGLTTITTPREVHIYPPILELPYTGEHFMLATDADNVWVSCIVLKDQFDTTKRRIHYWPC